MKGIANEKTITYCTFYCFNIVCLCGGRPNTYWQIGDEENDTSEASILNSVKEVAKETLLNTEEVQNVNSVREDVEDIAKSVDSILDVFTGESTSTNQEVSNDIYFSVEYLRSRDGDTQEFRITSANKLMDGTLQEVPISDVSDFKKGDEIVVRDLLINTPDYQNQSPLQKKH